MCFAKRMIDCAPTIMPTPMSVLSTPNAAEGDERTSRTYTERSAPKQRTANIPAVIERITKEIVECVKMKRKPSLIECNTDLGAGASARSRWMVSDMTIAAEKKKLSASNRKQAFAPTNCTSPPETL